jgi:hypothetical protein
MSDDPDDEPVETDDLIQETMREMISEAKIVPTGLEFPKEVIEAIEAYEKTHSIDRDHLIDEAFEAAKERMDESSETFARMMEDPDSFEWPVENPLLCVLIAFMRKTTQRWVEKMDKKHGVDKKGARRKAPMFIGIIISGSGSDGAKGIQAIKEAGGITFAEEKKSASFLEYPATPSKRDAWILF